MLQDRFKEQAYIAATLQPFRTFGPNSIKGCCRPDSKGVLTGASSPSESTHLRPHILHFLVAECLAYGV